MFLNKVLIALFIVELIFIRSPKSIKGESVLLEPWSIVGTLPYTLASYSLLNEQDNIYIFGGGGASDVIHDEILKTVESDGSSWEKVSQLPHRYIWHQMAKYKNNLYLIGGVVKNDDGQMIYTNKVYRSKLSIDGKIDSWTSISDLPDPRALGAVIVVKDYIYYIGGTNGSSISSVIFKSKILENGDISSWSYSSSTLPEPLSEVVLTVVGDIYYTFGGLTNNGATDKINKFVFDSLGGLLEVKHADIVLPHALRRPAVVTTPKHVVLLGGYNGQVFVDDIIYIEKDKLNTGSTNWVFENIKLPTPNCCNSAAYLNGKIYLFGGHNGDYLSDVVYSKTAKTYAPDYKQTDPRWSEFEYDSASQWSNLPTIRRWGCALTSAASVLSYYGHEVLPSDLNEWLKEQPDGYLRNGLINWLAISRFSRLDNSNNPVLEFERYKPDAKILNELLKSEQPSVVRLPGHFVTVIDSVGSDFSNDPASSLGLLSEAELKYGGQYSQINTFKPTHTDLSAFFFVYDELADVEIFDQYKNMIVDGEIFKEEPLISDSLPTEVGGTVFNSRLIEHPEIGNYIVSVNYKDSYNLNIYVYDKLGESMIFNASNSVMPTGKIGVVYGDHTSFVEISYDSLIDIIRKSYPIKIKNRAIYSTLKNIAMSARGMHLRGRSREAKLLVSNLARQVEILTPRFIEKDISDMLIFVSRNL